MRAVGKSSSGSTMDLTKPDSSASFASNTAPERHHSSDRLMPTILGKNQLDAASGTTPRRANGTLNRAALEAKRMSIGRLMVKPIPTAGPLIAAITGLSRRISEE
jgi:hypothetical protein